MKSRTRIFIGVAAVVALGAAAALRFARTRRPLEIRSDQLRYQEHSAAELASDHLLDLNSATREDFVHLGLDEESSDRIIDSRPYRNKLELLSRMVIPETTYQRIRGQIGIAGATEPVKVAL